jgi:hypothetical protein
MRIKVSRAEAVDKEQEDLKRNIFSLSLYLSHSVRSLTSEKVNLYNMKFYHAKNDSIHEREFNDILEFKYNYHTGKDVNFRMRHPQMITIPC